MFRKMLGPAGPPGGHLLASDDQGSPIMPKRLCLALAVLLSLPGMALAHSFNLLLVVPEDTAIAEDMRLAVLLAADERDGHPDNHSDGHLGVLDVYLTDTRALSEPAAWAEAEPDIVADPLVEPFAVYENPGWARVSPDDIATLDTSATLAEAADPSVAPFAERFRERTGRDPEAEAVAAYLAARVIDLIVRPLDSADDPDALRKELERLR